jgi:hypothetical protein
VSEVHPTGAVSVDVKGDNWTFSPFCINPEPDESLSDTSSEFDSPYPMKNNLTPVRENLDMHDTYTILLRMLLWYILVF